MHTREDVEDEADYIVPDSRCFKQAVFSKKISTAFTSSQAALELITEDTDWAEYGSFLQTLDNDCEQFASKLGNSNGPKICPKMIAFDTLAQLEKDFEQHHKRAAHDRDEMEATNNDWLKAKIWQSGGLYLFLGNDNIAYERSMHKKEELLTGTLTQKEYREKRHSHNFALLILDRVWYIFYPNYTRPAALVGKRRLWEFPLMHLARALRVKLAPARRPRKMFISGPENSGGLCATFSCRWIYLRAVELAAGLTWPRNEGDWEELRA